MCLLHIYIWYTPKTYNSIKFNGIYSVFLTFWTLQLRAFSGDQKLHFFCNSVPIPPFPKYIASKIQDSRFKAQKKLLESKRVGFKIQDSGLRRNFLNPRG